MEKCVRNTRIQVSTGFLLLHSDNNIHLFLDGDKTLIGHYKLAADVMHNYMCKKH